jgi:hypothetical protein
MHLYVVKISAISAQGLPDDEETADELLEVTGQVESVDTEIDVLMRVWISVSVDKIVLYAVTVVGTVMYAVKVNGAKVEVTTSVSVVSSVLMTVSILVDMIVLITVLYCVIVDGAAVTVEIEVIVVEVATHFELAERRVNLL